MKHHHHTPPALTAAQVAAARQDHAQGVSYKVMARTYLVSRYTLSRAIHGRGPYAGNTQKPPTPRGRRRKPPSA